MPDKKPTKFLISGCFGLRSGKLYRTFLSIANKIAMAMSDFSPPESSVML